MRKDSPSLLHPRVWTLYFCCLIVLVMAVIEPVFAGTSLVAGLACGLALRGWKSTLAPFRWQLPLMTLVCLVNPLITGLGATPLFALGPLVFRAESLAFGLTMGMLLVAMLVWFSNAAVLVDADQVQELIGARLPTVGLMVSMTMRLVPTFVRRARRADGARRACTAARAYGQGRKARIGQGFRITTALLATGLEGSLATAQSMRARGWGQGRRTQIRWTRPLRARDLMVLGGVVALITADVAAVVSLGGMYQFYPTMAPLQPWWSYFPHALVCLVPLVAQAASRMIWSASRAGASEHGADLDTRVRPGMVIR